MRKMPRTDRQLDEDHDTLTTLVGVSREMRDTLSKIDARLEKMYDQLAQNQEDIQLVQGSLRGRDMLLREHQEMYGFYLTFKQFFWPFLLSGPVAAVASAAGVYALTK